MYKRQFFDKLEKIKINCVPVLDTSGSMQDGNDSIGKATSIAHYLSKCSTFCPDYVVSFSSQPQLIHMGYDRKSTANSWRFYSQSGFKYDNTQSRYINEINSLYTGDCSNTNFAKVMDLLKDLEKTPDYLVVLSDMEFDEGSSMSKTQTMNYFKQKGYKTRIIWWNISDGRAKTAPETDEFGNVFISGYNPFLLSYLKAGFDGEKFLNNLLSEYEKKVKAGKK